MIVIKSFNEIEKIKKAAKILSEVKQIVWEATVEGVNILDLDALAEKEIIARGAKSNFKGYGGFPNATCISINDILIHGIPHDYVLKSGDLISIDFGCSYKGYHADSAFTKGIGKISESAKKVMDVAKKSFYRGLDAIKPGARVGDISAAIGNYVYENKMYVPDNFTGHGIGTALHEEPYIPNDGFSKTGPLLKDGMVICIEPMIMQGSKQTQILSDGWTVKALDGKQTAHYEHTILIEDGYGKILTGGI